MAVIGLAGALPLAPAGLARGLGAAATFRRRVELARQQPAPAPMWGDAGRADHDVSEAFVGEREHAPL